MKYAPFYVILGIFSGFSTNPCAAVDCTGWAQETDFSCQTNDDCTKKFQDYSWVCNVPGYCTDPHHTQYNTCVTPDASFKSARKKTIRKKPSKK